MLAFSAGTPCILSNFKVLLACLEACSESVAIQKCARRLESVLERVWTCHLILNGEANNLHGSLHVWVRLVTRVTRTEHLASECIFTLRPPTATTTPTHNHNDNSKHKNHDHCHQNKNNKSKKHKNNQKEEEEEEQQQEEEEEGGGGGWWWWWWQKQRRPSPLESIGSRNAVEQIERKLMQTTTFSGASEGLPQATMFWGVAHNVTVWPWYFNLKSFQTVKSPLPTCPFTSLTGFFGVPPRQERMLLHKVFEVLHTLIEDLSLATAHDNFQQNIRKMRVEHRAKAWA